MCTAWLLNMEIIEIWLFVFIVVVFHSQGYSDNYSMNIWLVHFDPEEKIV